MFNLGKRYKIKYVYISDKMTYNEKMKNCIMRWREANPDKYRESQKLYQQKIYKDNYTNKRQEQKKIAYQWKRQTLIMLNMLNNLYPL